MAFTQSDADNLRRAIARGVRTVKMNGEEVQYNTFAEMKAALAMIEAELAGASGGGFAVVYPRTGRGL